MTTPRDEPQRHPLRCETCGHYLRSDCAYFHMGYEPIEERTASTEFLRGCYFVLRGRCPDHTSTNTGAQERIDAVVEIIEMQIGCSDMLYDDGNFDDEAYSQLRAECKRAIALLKEGGRK